MNRVIYKSKSKAIRITVAGCLLVAAGSAFFLWADDRTLGWIFLISAALVLTLGISTYFDRKPQIILTDTGITELFTIREEVEWKAILGADDFWYRGQQFIRLLLPSGYKPGSIPPGWFHRLDALYRKEGYRAVYIRASGLDVHPDELLRMILAQANAE